MTAVRRSNRFANFDFATSTSTLELVESLGIHKANKSESIKVDHDKHVVGGARQGPIELWGGDKDCLEETAVTARFSSALANVTSQIAMLLQGPSASPGTTTGASGAFHESSIWNVNDDAKYSRAKARGCAIEAAARTCRDDGRALAALGIFMGARRKEAFVDAECVFLDGVLAAGGDWVAAKRTIVEIVALQSDLRLSCNDDLI